MFRRLPDQRCHEAVRPAARLRWSGVDVNQHASGEYGDSATSGPDTFPTPSPTRCSCGCTGSIARSSATSAWAWHPLRNNYRFSCRTAAAAAPLAASHRDLGLPGGTPSKGAATATATGTGFSASATWTGSGASVTGSCGNPARSATSTACGTQSAPAQTSATATSCCRVNSSSWHPDALGSLRGSDLHCQ